MRIAVLGPGGVGGLVAGALQRAHEQPVRDGKGTWMSAPAGAPVSLVAQASTVAVVQARGLRVSSVLLGDFTVHPPIAAELSEDVDCLIVATKAAGLAAALERVHGHPALVLPLLNGLDHLALLRERFDPASVVAGTIRVEADRPEPGVVVHTSRFLRVDMASRHREMDEPMRRLASVLSAAGVPARAYEPPSGELPADGGEAQVMWSKLVRLN
ncbi:MAG TPA: 2-dehydropantoate 2-reductase N-terminal domain-containing protein, partial [Solirubrobacteraceae bacterium]|nr:2-dehydropantoate 2-reductase N-terminal domain-containing protein [Solirubrobacteraceae bacterium]